MNLEKHFDKERINVKNLILEQEKEPILESQEMYEKLKKTPLYETGFWREYINEDQELVRGEIGSNNQLLGVLVESLFDKESAERQYKALKQSSMYNKEKKAWYSTGTRADPGAGYLSENQLLGIWAESLFNKKLAQEQYKELKETRFYDKERGQWLTYTYLGAVVGEDNPIRYSENQLLGVLTESLFDKDSARKQYENLKQTPLYDKKTKQWNCKMEEKQKLLSDARFSDHQLLGILAESLFNKNSARKIYENLKTTSLYDEKWKQWNSKMNKNQELQTSIRYSGTQLLGVLVHYLFEDKSHIFKQKTPPIPRARKF